LSTVITVSTVSTQSRRLTSRVETDGNVWVFWECNKRDGLSRVRNLGSGGLFVETSLQLPKGLRARLHFLVPEGQIRAEAVIRHGKPSEGLGMKFTAVNDSDRPQLTALLTRMRRIHHSKANP
jgi:hypothetical protein